MSVYDEELLQSIMNNDVDTACSLLQRGANPNYLSSLINEGDQYRKEDYGTPLHMASELDNVDMVQLLLEYNADPNKRGHTPKVPLDTSTWHKNVKIIELFIPHTHLDHINKLSCLAVQSLDKQIIEIFIKHGLDLSKISLCDFLEVYEYTGINEFELIFKIIEFLIHHGVDWNKPVYKLTPKQFLIKLQNKFVHHHVNYQKLIDLLDSYDEPIKEVGIDIL